MDVRRGGQEGALAPPPYGNSMFLVIIWAIGMFPPPLWKILPSPVKILRTPKPLTQILMTGNTHSFIKIRESITYRQPHKKLA